MCIRDSLMTIVSVKVVLIFVNFYRISYHPRKIILNLAITAVSLSKKNVYFHRFYANIMVKIKGNKIYFTICFLFPQSIWEKLSDLKFHQILQHLNSKSEYLKIFNIIWSKSFIYFKMHHWLDRISSYNNHCYKMLSDKTKLF